MELRSYPDVDKLPPRLPLKQALDLPTDAVRACQGIAVTSLQLSVRPLNCFVKNDIEHLDTLLSLTINDLFAIPAMGRTSVIEVIKRIYDFFFDPPMRFASNQPFAGPINTKMEWTSLTLRDEWNTYSYAANASAPISMLYLTVELSSKLQELQVYLLNDVLDWTLDDSCERLGDDDADQLLTAIVATAQEQRNLKITLAEEGTISREHRTRLLVQRWFNVPISQCGFKSRTRALLAAAGVGTLGRLLEALDPLIPALCFDLPAFCDIWNRLTALNLRYGDAFAEWEQRLEDEQCTINLDVIVEAMKQVCADRQWIVLNLRYGFIRAVDETGDKTAEDREVDHVEPARLTLEEVAQKLVITRERVRQIELAATTKLQEVATGVWHSLIATLRYLMRRAGGVLTLADAAQELATRFNSNGINTPNLCYLLFELSDSFASIQRGKIYCLGSIPVSHYQRVIERAIALCKSSPVNLDEAELTQNVQASLAQEQQDFDLPFIAACLQTDARFLSELTRHDLNFHLAETLRRLGKPAHYTEIAEKLNASGWRPYQVSEKSVNSRLNGERDLFVYLHRGVYGLVEWGMEDRRVFDRYKNGFIGDHIETFLTERDVPAETSEIIAYVLSKKRCQGYSVLMSLSRDGRFHALSRGRYGLKKWVQ